MTARAIHDINIFPIKYKVNSLIHLYLPIHGSVSDTLVKPLLHGQLAVLSIFKQTELSPQFCFSSSVHSFSA